jgi:transposase
LKLFIIVEEQLFSVSDVRSMLALCARVVALPAQLTTWTEIVVGGIAELIEARSAFACELVAEPAEPWRFNRFLVRYGGGRWRPAVHLLETLAGSAQMPARGSLTLLGDVLPTPAGPRMLARPEYLFRSRRSVASIRHVAGSVICVAFYRLSSEFCLRDRALVDLLFGWPWLTVEANGDTTITDKVTITQTRKTYAQNWPAYNEAQTNEKRQFQILLADLCKGIKGEDEDEKPGRGRPRFPLRDAVFSIVFKVYSTYSGRRFTSDLCDAQAKGYIDRVPHYNTAFKYIENPNLYPILLSMIERASLPLKAVEENFAVDSTGFCFSRFTRWFDVKYNKFTSKQEWVKAHICTGVKTNVVTAIEIHGKDAGDAPQLPSLVQTTAKNFTMKEVSADKGYTGGETHDAIANVGAVPFIAFKANATGGIGGLFGKMFHYFNYRRDEFLAHYHQRSNVESTVTMIKTKFGDGLRGKSDVAGRNEVLCKTLRHNICCLISAMYELGITPTFGL